MNGYETKNSITRRRKSRKKAVIAVVAAILTLAILAVFLLSRETGVIDANGTPSRGLSFDKTSITSKTYTLVGIGACKDTDIIVPAEKVPFLSSAMVAVDIHSWLTRSLTCVAEYSGYFSLTY